MIGQSVFGQLLDLGKLAALIGIPYLIGVRRRERQHFKFDFVGSSGSMSKESRDMYKWEIEGIVKNVSNLNNTINRIYLIVWKNKKRNSFLRMGYENIKVLDTSKNIDILLPIYFKKREAKKLRVSFEITIKGGSDEKLLTEYDEIRPGSGLLVPKYNYQLCFEDIDGNYFDQRGKLVNINEANLWWTLENTFSKLKEWNILPFAKHSLSIVFEKVGFHIRLILWNLGF